MSRDLLAEHCDAPGCVNGSVATYTPDGDRVSRVCRDCAGTTRRIRGTHDARSAIDYEPQPDTAPRFVARVVALVARHPNDADLGAAVRALLDELGAVGR
jgi:hypothetical protein